MSGFFAGLVARATGAEASGLRPRLPALFESAVGEAGLAEHQVERPASSVIPATRAERVRDEPPVRVAATIDPDRPEANSASLAPPADQILRAVPAALLRTEPSRPTPTSAPEPHRPAPSHNLAPPVPSPADDPPHPAPAALLPVQPIERLRQTIIERLAGEGPHPARHAAPDPAKAASEPEITIQIGRLDIRTDAPPPQPSPRRAPSAPSLPSLSDYLRGGRR